MAGRVTERRKLIPLYISSLVHYPENAIQGTISVSIGLSVRQLHRASETEMTLRRYQDGECNRSGAAQASCTSRPHCSKRPVSGQLEAHDGEGTDMQEEENSTCPNLAAAYS